MSILSVAVGTVHVACAPPDVVKKYCELGQFWILGG